MFSEENQSVATKHEIQLLFRIHLLFVVFQRFSTTTVIVTWLRLSPEGLAR